MYSNQQVQYQQPFNQFGMQPYYKWVKFFLGYNNMVFSSYSLNGHIFLGAGIQLTPGIFRFSAMYGRLNQAIAEDTLNRSVIPYYERRGMAIKVGVGKGSDYIDLIGFYAKDDSNTIARPFKQNIRPAENLVFSVIASKSIFKNLILTAEYAGSLFTNDLGAAARTDKIKDVGADPFQVINQNTSTTYNRAYKANLTYGRESYSIGIGFEHIDPEYRTLGAYYFNNDLEQYTINGTKRFLAGKLNVAANIGIQRNNLRGEKIANMNRNVGSINVQYIPSSKWNFSASYSNFQTYTRVRTQFERINAITPQDTLQLNPLDFVQLSHTAQAGMGHVLGDPNSKIKRTSVNINLTYQNVSNSGTSERVSTGTKMYSSILTFNKNFMPRNFSYNLSFNTNLNEIETTKMWLFGPSFGITKSFFAKQLKVNSSLAYTTTVVNEKKSGDIYTLRVGSSYLVKKHHTFSLTLTATYRYGGSSALKIPTNFSEITANMGYGYNF